MAGKVTVNFGKLTLCAAFPCTSHFGVRSHVQDLLIARLHLFGLFLRSPVLSVCSQSFMATRAFCPLHPKVGIV